MLMSESFFYWRLSDFVTSSAHWDTVQNTYERTIGAESGEPSNWKMKDGSYWKDASVTEKKIVFKHYSCEQMWLKIIETKKTISAPTGTSPDSVKQNEEGWRMSYLLALLSRRPKPECPHRAVSKWVNPPPPSVPVAVHMLARGRLPASPPQQSTHPPPPQTHCEAHTEVTHVAAVCLLFPHVDLKKHVQQQEQQSVKGEHEGRFVSKIFTA